MSLHEIGKKHGTDKSGNNHTHHGLSYLHIYEKYLEEKRDQKNNILELGVLGGKSIRTWHEYFPESNIIGIDIDPARKDIFNDERIEILIGSQTDEDIRDMVASKYKTLDVVIDDASHINQLTLKSFEIYWPIIASKGVYIMEDLTYDTITDPGINGWPGQKYNYKNGEEYLSQGTDLLNFIVNNIIKMQHADAVASIHLYPEIIIVTKI